MTHKKINTITFLLFCFIVMGWLLVNNFKDHSKNLIMNHEEIERSEEEGPEAKQCPTNYFQNQRVFPHEEFHFDAFLESKLYTQEMRKNTPFRAFVWEFVGPTNIGGRISDVEWHPTDQNICYYAASSGGIFKSTDQGKTFTPIFDNEATLNTGDICLAPSNPDIIYVGTGEVNPGGGSITYPGLGVFKSTDAGKTWKHMGLEATQLIGRIKVHPTNPDIVYVAATGRLYGSSDERGVYRSKDGGKNWDKVLFVSGKTGAVDLSINPKNPDILYAAMWERFRKPGIEEYGGAECAIYRTKDGGENWNKLTSGLPSGRNVGRIGIDLCDSQPDILYAYISTAGGGLLGNYKTTNGGDTWTEISKSNCDVASYSWWFSNIRVDPNNPDNVFFLGYSFSKSTDGGKSWRGASGGMHVDHHGLAIHPKNSNLCVEGNDGGVYISTNGGTRWTKTRVQPITQFYSVAVENSSGAPKKIIAGAQDNGVCMTQTAGSSDWRGVIGGDGLDVAIDPTNANYVYGESQYGALRVSSNGGSNFSGAGSFSGTKGWKCPIAVDPSNGHVFFGTTKVFKSTRHGSSGSWSEISGDLTRSEKFAKRTDENDPFGTITVITVAPSNSNYIYAGCDNGNVWVTKNGGGNWTQIDDALPDHWITCITVSENNPDVVYVTVSGYRFNTEVAHISKTTDAGKTWKNISGNLPNAPLNWVIVDPNNEGYLYVASDMGPFISMDDGNTWSFMGTKIPNVVIHELAYHKGTKTIYAGTFGRGVYKIDVSNPTPVISPSDKNTETFKLFQNYPNPMIKGTTIKFSLTQSAKIKVSIYDLSGRLVRTLVDKNLTGGTHSVYWDRKNDQGTSVAAGNYVYRLRTGKKVLTKRLIVK